MHACCFVRHIWLTSMKPNLENTNSHLNPYYVNIPCANKRPFIFYFSCIFVIFFTYWDLYKSTNRYDQCHQAQSCQQFLVHWNPVWKNYKQNPSRAWLVENILSVLFGALCQSTFCIVALCRDSQKNGWIKRKSKFILFLVINQYIWGF